MSIKSATLSDIPELIKLINSSYTNDDGQGAGWTNINHLVTGPRLNPDNPLELISAIKNNSVNNIFTILKYEDENQRSKILGCVKLNIERNNNDIGYNELGQTRHDNNKAGQNKEEFCTKKLLCSLGILAVSPYAQGKGIGKKLLEASENWAESKSCSAIEIRVANAREDLIEFYERKGFVKTGETVPFPIHPGSAIPTTPFHLVVLEKIVKY